MTDSTKRGLTDVFEGSRELSRAYGRRTSDALRDPRSVRELFDIALHALDETMATEATCTLKWRGSREVFEECLKYIESPLAQERQFGVEVLGELGLPPAFPDESGAALLGLMMREHDADVLAAIGFAFENLHDPRGIPHLARLKNHVSADVRYAVVHGISGFDDDLAIETLIELSEDPNPTVRDWATFGLAQRINRDSAEIRDALLHRCIDRDDDTRSEAIMGLVRRGDDSAPELLLRELKRPVVGLLTLEGAAETSDSRLYEPLVRLREAWKGTWNEDELALRNALAAAIVSCKPRT